MALINFQQKEIIVKIVYYGPSFSGKTTNIKKLHELIPNKLIGDLTTLDTDDERTLFFDYFPVKAGAIGRYKLKLQIYSIPGQAYYRATRRMVLQNADGVVFVADSQSTEIEHNIVAFSDLEENLKSYISDIENFPIVIQYNKRDLKNSLPTDFLDRKLNLRGYPYCEGVATEGKGVLEAFNGIVELVTRRLRTELSRTEKGQPLDGSFFQPLTGEYQNEQAVSDLFHKISDLGEHGEADLKDALSTLGEAFVEPLEHSNQERSSKNSNTSLGNQSSPLDVNLQKIEDLQNGFFRLDMTTNNNNIRLVIKKEQFSVFINQLVTKQPIKQIVQTSEAKLPEKLMPVVFIWLGVVTIWLLLRV